MSSATISFAETKTDTDTPANAVYNTSNNIIASGTFGSCPWTIDDSGSLIIQGGSLPNTILSSPWKQYSELITSIEIIGTVKAGSYINYLFDGLSKVTTIQNLNNIDTSLTTRMMYVFRNCSALQQVDLSGWDTSNTTTFTSMFNGCSSITSLDLSSFETGQTSSYYQMFNNCPSLRELNISSFGKNGVTSGYNMFDISNKNLVSITVGEYTPFKLDAHGLPEINALGAFTGGWIGKETSNYYSSTLEFTSKYDGSVPDTYVWATHAQVNYVDQNGETLSDPKEILGYLGGYYDATLEDYQLTIPGYTLDLSRLPQNASGIFTPELQIITYVYTEKPDIGGEVTVGYVDTDGNLISDNIILSGNVGDSFSSEQKSISGYTFKEVLGSATGVFTDAPQTVTYVYTKEPSVGGKVTVRYVDTDGNPISDNIILSGNVGDSFSTEQKLISGYTFKEVEGLSSGNFTTDLQIITYIYTKDSTILDNPDADSSESVIDQGQNHNSTLPKTSELRSNFWQLIGTTLIAMIIANYLLAFKKSNK
nr:MULTISPECIES: MucBP domain-containing protein [unclassified Enterococcus]